MGLPQGGVTLNEVMEWAQEQSQFLTPTQTLVLWYLCINAFRTDENPEGALAGYVFSGRVPQAKICLRTGLSRHAVRDALIDLQDTGYIIYQSKRGRGESECVVFWSETADEMRAEVRAGIREIPEGMKRKKQPSNNDPLPDNVVQLNAPERRK